VVAAGRTVTVIAGFTSWMPWRGKISGKRGQPLLGKKKRGKIKACGPEKGLYRLDLTCSRRFQSGQSWRRIGPTGNAESIEGESTKRGRGRGVLSLGRQWEKGPNRQWLCLGSIGLLERNLKKKCQYFSEKLNNKESKHIAGIKRGLIKGRRCLNLLPQLTHSGKRIVEKDHHRRQHEGEKRKNRQKLRRAVGFNATPGMEAISTIKGRTLISRKQTTNYDYEEMYGEDQGLLG